MAGDTKELRLDLRVCVMQALDAFAMSEGEHRSTYVAALLEEHVMCKTHKHTVTGNMLKGNPLLAESERRKRR